MYAVIEAGGKQHKVELGQTLEIDLMDEESGAEHAFETVMLYVDGEDVQVGQPYIENAKVIAEVVDEVKGEKVSILRFQEENIACEKLVIDKDILKLKLKKLT